MARPSWFSRLVLPVLVAGCVAASAKADVVTTFVGTDPNQVVNVSATQNGTTRSINNEPVGPFVFVVSPGQDGGTGLGPTFRSFCANFFKDVSLGQTISYTPESVSGLPSVNGDANKLNKIQRLFDFFYAQATDPADTTATKGGAFQLALWKILYDPNSTDLSSGNFTAIGPGSPTSVSLAQTWLTTIGNSTIPDNGPKYTLLGLYSATAQDQIVPVTPVPAPAGVVLLAVGAVGLVVRRRLVGKKAETAEATDDTKA